MLNTNKKWTSNRVTRPRSLSARDCPANHSARPASTGISTSLKVDSIRM